jgi:hypothetical protein
MIEAAESAGVHFIVGQSQSYKPPVRAMRHPVRSGDLGQLGMISSWYFNDWLYRPRLPAELNTGMGGGYDHFFSTELTDGQTEGGTRVDPLARGHGATSCSHTRYLPTTEGVFST